MRLLQSSAKLTCYWRTLARRSVGTGPTSSSWTGRRNCAPDALSESPGTRRLYVVERGQIERLLAVAPSTMGVLVKPVSRTVLKLALEQAIALSAADPIGRPSADPADRDDILQCLLQANLRLQEYDYDRSNFLAQ